MVSGRKQHNENIILCFLLKCNKNITENDNFLQVRNSKPNFSIENKRKNPNDERGKQLIEIWYGGSEKSRFPSY